MRITANQKGISVDGKLVFENTQERYVYKDIHLTTKDYALYGVHGENPHCYPYLDKVFVLNKATGESQIVNVFEQISDKSYKIPLATIEKLDKDTFIAIGETGKKAIIDAKLMFTPELKVGDTISPTYDKEKLETYFDYYIGEGSEPDKPSVLMTLKDDVPRTNLLRFNGLSLEYDIFKFSGNIYNYGTSALMMCDSKENSSWTIHWGHSTTLTSEEIWDRRNTLRQCLEKMTPNLPQVKEQLIVQEYKM